MLDLFTSICFVTKPSLAALMLAHKYEWLMWFIYGFRFFICWSSSSATHRTKISDVCYQKNSQLKTDHINKAHVRMKFNTESCLRLFINLVFAMLATRFFDCIHESDFELIKKSLWLLLHCFKTSVALLIFDQVISSLRDDLMTILAFIKFCFVENLVHYIFLFSYFGNFW